MSVDTEDFHFAGLARPVRFAGCGALAATVAARLNGWAVAPWPANEPIPAPIIAVTSRGSHFILTGMYIDGEETYPDETDAACAFAAELIMAHGRANPDLVFLHGGAAMLDGRLIVYPAEGKTGKSTLTAQIAARGARIFSDDVVPVSLTTGTAHALGIEPHLRLPLPEALPEGDRRWIAGHLTLANSRLAYLGLPRTGAGALAPLGEESRVGGFVLLERRDDAVPSLSTCARADVMKLIIRQNFGNDRPASELLPRFKALVESAPCWRLRYRGGGEAADLLQTLSAAA